jgi:hypothetical protein
MKIEYISIGGWFQRTSLHLDEIYDFLKTQSSPLKLDSTKLKKLHKNLQIADIKMVSDNLEYLHITTKNNIQTTFSEDGLITLTIPCLDPKALKKNITQLTTYYEKHISPALSYLFSLGAPIPKELANIATIYPYFIVVNNATTQEITRIIKQFGEEEYTSKHTDSLDIYRGHKLYIINNKNTHPDVIQKMIEENIFLRECKSQMHRYLNIHRQIWEKIDDIKEQKTIKGTDINAFHNTLKSYNKTIDLIYTRIKQMGLYIKTRQDIITKNSSYKDISSLLEYKYDTLNNTLCYIKEIWNMTITYVKKALKLFDELQKKSTEKSLKALTIVTSMGVGGTLLGLLTKQMPTFHVSGVVYFFLLAAIGYITNKGMKYYYQNKNYHINTVDIIKKIT